MDTTESDPRDDPERAPAQGFQSEGGEHLRSQAAAQARRVEPGPATAYQHEDDEPLD